MTTIGSIDVALLISAKDRITIVQAASRLCWFPQLMKRGTAVAVDKIYLLLAGFKLYTNTVHWNCFYGLHVQAVKWQTRDWPHFKVEQSVWWDALKAKLTVGLKYDVHDNDSNDHTIRLITPTTATTITTVSNLRAGMTVRTEPPLPPTPHPAQEAVRQSGSRVRHISSTGLQCIKKTTTQNW